MAKAIKKTSNKTILTNESFQFFKTYINNASPVGFETWGQKLWLEYLKPYVDTHYVDPYGTAVGVINPTHPFKVVIEAHADEISWFVNYITAAGLLYLKKKRRGRSPNGSCFACYHPREKRPCKGGLRLACHSYSFGCPRAKRT